MVFTLISNNFSKARIRKEFSSEGYSCSSGLGLSRGFLTFCGIDGLEKTIGLTSFADPSAKKKITILQSLHRQKTKPRCDSECPVNPLE